MRPVEHESEGGRPRGVLVTSADSDGAFALMEYEIPPRILVAPLHTHHVEDEYSYVLSGRVAALIGGEKRESGPRGLIVKPRGIPHTLWNPGDGPTRVLELIAPGGFERCLAELFAAGGPPLSARLQELWAEYGIDMEADTVSALLNAYGLRGSLTPA